MKPRHPVAFATAIAIAGATATAAAGTVTVEVQSGRNVRVFVPTKPAVPTPLVVMLHGCTQTPDDFADATQMDVLAEKEGFVVAYPEQSASTIATRCFQWWEPAHQARDAGEPKELADAALAVAKGHGVDEERVYVGGISAGAAMSVILGATYPDRFVAIGVIAGVEYKRATTLSGGLSVSQNGGPGADMQGDLAFAAMGTRARPVPTFVVHGTSDGVVAPINGDQVADQWRRTNTLVLGDGAIDPVATAPGTAGYPFVRKVHRNKANGASVIEYYVVDGLGHAWPGGKMGASYSDPRGPDATALMWAFWKGRTRTAPFDVPAVVLPSSPGSTTPDGGTPVGDPATPADPNSPTASSPASSDGGGGCGMTREHDPSRRQGLGALLLGLAVALGARRGRRS
jgi:poly(hydroxyalkanoate) depolymerase family esterase